MRFETQYKIFVVALLLGVCFYVAGDALTSAMVEGRDFLLSFFVKLGVKIVTFAVILFISLFFLGIGTILGPHIPRLSDVHLIYAHLTTLSTFAVYGIYLTLDNLSIYLNGVRLVECIPIYIPMYISILEFEFMTRYLLIVLAIAAAIVKDVVDYVSQTGSTEKESIEKEEESGKEKTESEKEEQITEARPSKNTVEGTVEKIEDEEPVKEFNRAENAQKVEEQEVEAKAESENAIEPEEQAEIGDEVEEDMQGEEFNPDEIKFDETEGK